MISVEDIKNRLKEDIRETMRICSMPRFEHDDPIKRDLEQQVVVMQQLLDWIEKNHQITEKDVQVFDKIEGLARENADLKRKNEFLEKMLLMTHESLVHICGATKEKK